MHLNSSSVKLGENRYADAADLSDQYWAQRPSKGYVEGGREPRFNATASERPDYIENIHKPVANFDESLLTKFSGKKSTDIVTVGDDYEFFGFDGPLESDAAHPD